MYLCVCVCVGGGGGGCVCVCVCVLKLHAEPAWDGGSKVCSRGLGPLRPYMKKSSEPMGRFP